MAVATAHEAAATTTVLSIADDDSDFCSISFCRSLVYDLRKNEKKVASGKKWEPRLPPLRLIKDKRKSIELGKQRMDEVI